ncbi:hypothetical protein IX51_04485 [uncultured archaeon]|nr:hypothetical protein IX51_04485 [uncultured archaeon]
MVFLSTLNAFGAAAVTVMMVSYVAEERGTVYTFIFGISSFGASIYGWLSGTWPFGIIEGVWALFALRKWYRRKHPISRVEGTSEKE